MDKLIRRGRIIDTIAHVNNDSEEKIQDIDARSNTWLHGQLPLRGGDPSDIGRSLAVSLGASRTRPPF
jgi:hypothetical protein